MRKKKLPLFVFTLSGQIGISLIAGGIIHDSSGNLIEETKYYDLRKDCNGVSIVLSKVQKGKVKATTLNPNPPNQPIIFKQLRNDCY